MIFLSWSSFPDPMVIVLFKCSPWSHSPYSPVCTAPPPPHQRSCHLHYAIPTSIELHNNHGSHNKAKSQVQGPFLTSWSCVVQYLVSVSPPTTIPQAKFWWNEKSHTFLPQHICPQHWVVALVLCSTEMFLCSSIDTTAISQALSHGTSSQDKVSSSNFIGHNSLQVLPLCTLCFKFSCKWFTSPHQENKEWASTAVVGLPCLLHIRHAGSSHVYFFFNDSIGNHPVLKHTYSQS